jgi:uncharacterized protein (TIGR03382 family)
MGAFTASVTYDYVSGTTASLTIAITNTTSASYGGYITALAFNWGASGITSHLVSSSHAAFGDLSAPVSAEPYGTFQSGISTSDSWLGGGNPNSGIAVGSTGTFVFTLTGGAGALGSLTAANVMMPVSEYGMVVRYRGMTNGGSDKVIGQIIPGPGALAALALAAGLRRRRRGA